MDKYVCKNCNYQFERGDVSDCPHCGNEEIEEEKDAGALLEDVNRLLKK
jgi:predicted Zn-ribbon and HTH transcriptional regulator